MCTFCLLPALNALTRSTCFVTEFRLGCRVIFLCSPSALMTSLHNSTSAQCPEVWQKGSGAGFRVAGQDGSTALPSPSAAPPEDREVTDVSAAAAAPAERALPIVSEPADRAEHR
mmetsp:Transcript_74860/g.243136  ORF Transcript_74860/g.243136 Transcript_74860/m.243136 type:complete len:115 (+) Transcript_74860:169-513(+)